MTTIIGNSHYEQNGITMSIINNNVEAVYEANIVDLFELATNQPFPVQQVDESDEDFIIRQNTYAQSFLFQTGKLEKLTESGKEATILRQELSNNAFVKNVLSNVGTENIDINQFTSTNKVTESTAIRWRSYPYFPLAFIIGITSYYLSMSETFRYRLQTYFTSEVYIPSILQTFLESVRQSRLLNLELKPKLNPLPNSFLTAVGWEKSIMDLSYIETEQGFIQYVSFISQLHNFDSSYISYTSLKSPREFFSGTTTTLTSLTTEPFAQANVNVPYVTSSSNEEGKIVKVEKTYVHESYSCVSDVYLAPGHSYGQAVDGLHCLHTLLFKPRIKRVSDNTSLPSITLTPIRVAFTTESLILSFIRLIVKGSQKPGNLNNSSKGTKGDNTSSSFKTWKQNTSRKDDKNNISRGNNNPRDQQSYNKKVFEKQKSEESHDRDQINKLLTDLKTSFQNVIELLSSSGYQQPLLN